MRKFITAILTTFFLLSATTACSAQNDGKVNIICTVFSEYDWARNIIGDDDSVKITLLQDNGADLHSFSPTVDDIAKISTCDMFVFVGGESDAWTVNTLQNVKNNDMITVNLMTVLHDRLKEEEIKEGMQTDDHEHEHDEEEAEHDEHVWLSLKNAVICVRYLTEKLCLIVPDSAEKYKTNCEAYVDELEALDAEYSQTVQSASNKTLVFGDRFPFRYLFDDYGIDYFAAFVGCSAETEASFETFVFLAQKIDELGLDNIFIIEGGSRNIAESIIQNTTDKNQSILTLNSLQSVTQKNVNDGANYLSIMRSNLSTLETAMN